MKSLDFTLHASDITIENDPLADSLRGWVRILFDAWLAEKPKVGIDSSAAQGVTINAVRRSEGRGAASTFEVEMRRKAGQSLIGRFIIRAYGGEGATESAELERKNSKLFASCGADLFSSRLLAADTLPTNVVAYRHADDEFSSESKILKNIIEEIIVGDSAKAQRMTEAIGALSRELNAVYEQIHVHEITIAGSAYFDSIRQRLLPDIVIDARARTVDVSDGLITVSTEEDSSPPKDESRISSTDAARLSNSLEALTHKPRWLSFTVWLTRRKQGYISFMGNGISLWLLIEDNNQLADSILMDKEYKLTLFSDKTLLMTGVAYLRLRGVTPDVILSSVEFEQLCNRFETISQRLRHTDLHCGNVLSTDRRLKIIDLENIAYDVIDVSVARLEVSLWRAVQGKIRPDDAEALLFSLEKGKEPNFENLDPPARALGRLLGSLRGPQLVTESQPRRLEIALAYCTQVLFHHRYLAENRSIQAEPSFEVVARYWSSRLRETLKVVEPPASINESESGTDVFPNSRPTLRDLWEKALTDPKSSSMGRRAERVLGCILANDQSTSRNSLTDIQSKLIDAYREEDGGQTLDSRVHELPFQSNRHVIISAPTSTGKSKLAEMFLVVPGVRNASRRCSLYIAPTRALAQAKYRDLRLLLKGSELEGPETDPGIVLSTGEDSDHDWRITHGAFYIACMVYEKANILFSQNRKLLSRIGCVVVDELHMLMDLDRGPALEVAQVKVLQERHDLDMESSRDPYRETLRVVAISTEDKQDDAIMKLYTLRNPDLPLDYREPLAFHSPSRPVAVQHNLLLAGRNAGQYEICAIVKFRDSFQRLLSRQQMSEVDRRIDAIEARTSRVAALCGDRNESRELQDRVTNLVVDLLSKHEKGYRILVFVPGRSVVENLAQRLRKLRIKGAQSEAVLAAQFEEATRKLRSHADSAENRRTATAVLRCANAGIFIHHADIETKLRREVEEVCAVADPSSPSQVLYATETLSYGVNLAVQDVILVGTEFLTRTRMRQLKQEYLEPCEFHNMCGRAGRLGKTPGDSSNVYIAVPSDQLPMSVVSRYYSAIPLLSSKLYVSDDQKKQIDIRSNVFRALMRDQAECSEFRGLGALDFSYPFVRSILDILRHLNMPRESRSAFDFKTPASYEILEQFLSSTLYASQRFRSGTQSTEKKLFTCAVKRVLEDCSQGPLHLTSRNENVSDTYTITSRGEALIDTGTELQTIGPLLEFVQNLQLKWKEVCGKALFPVELYILPLIAQEEICRQIIRYPPECRGGEADRSSWDAELVEVNRREVLNACEESLKSLGKSLPAAELSLVCRTLLDKWELIRKYSTAYPDGASDSVLRLFSSMIAWINGVSRSRVDDIIEQVHGGPEELQGRMQGFRQFTEQLSWKGLCLVRMLATSEPGTVAFGPSDERMFYRLVARLRLGCTVEAIPLFWPHSSDFSRSQAVELVASGMTPSRMLSHPDPWSLLSTGSVGITKLQLFRLEQDLGAFARKEFEELASEMSERHSEDERRNALQSLWKDLTATFHKGTEQFKRSEGIPVKVDEAVQNCFGSAAFQGADPSDSALTLGSSGRSRVDERFRIRIEIPENQDGIYWLGELSQPDLRIGETPRFDVRYEVKVLCVQIRTDWHASDPDGKWTRLAEVIEREFSVRHLAIVAIPWLPSRDSMTPGMRSALKARSLCPRFTTTFLSPAAFATIATAIGRDFLSGESFLKLLVDAQINSYRVIELRDLQEILLHTQNPMPKGLREKLIRHFEVEYDQRDPDGGSVVPGLVELGARKV